MISLKTVYVSEQHVSYYDYDGDLWGDDSAVVKEYEEQIRAEVSRRLGFDVNLTCIGDGNGHMTWLWERKKVTGETLPGGVMGGSRLALVLSLFLSGSAWAGHEGSNEQGKSASGSTHGVSETMVRVWAKLAEIRRQMRNAETCMREKR